jgi:hypothetical protein
MKKSNGGCSDLNRGKKRRIFSNFEGLVRVIRANSEIISEKAVGHDG